jgi:hypothetical protein
LEPHYQCSIPCPLASLKYSKEEKHCTDRRRWKGRAAGKIPN